MPSAQPAHNFDDEINEENVAHPGLVLIDGGVGEQQTSDTGLRAKLAARAVLGASVISFLLAFGGRLGDAGRVVALGELVAAFTWMALLVLVIFVGRRKGKHAGVGGVVLCSLVLTVGVRVAQSSFPAY